MERVYCKKSCTEYFFYKKGEYYEYESDRKNMFIVYHSDGNSISFPVSMFRRYFITISDLRDLMINKLLD